MVRRGAGALGGGGRTLRAGVGGPGPRGPGWAQQGDPDEFMRQVSEYVNRSIVMHVQTETDAGTTITAWVRRGPDGLFSVLTADGPLDGSGQRAANTLEASVREAVGLD